MRSLALLALTLMLTACGDGESPLPPDARLPDGGPEAITEEDALTRLDGALERALALAASMDTQRQGFEGRANMLEPDDELPRRP